MARRPVQRPARKPAAKSERPATTNGPAAPITDRDKIVAALLALLADKSFETIGLADIAARAGVSLAQLRDEFPSTSPSSPPTSKRPTAPCSPRI